MQPFTNSYAQFTFYYCLFHQPSIHWTAVHRHEKGCNRTSWTA